MTEQKIALVLGATGGVGGEIARLLVARGWEVRALNRNPSGITNPIPGVKWMRGDAMNQNSVVAAATGAALIVHGVNPPGYRNWAGLALPMLDNTIAAARACGARIFFPGTLYNFGLDVFALVAEDAPQNPITRKGKIRAEMEARLSAASKQGVRTLILRAGDWFGPRITGNSWFGAALVKPGRPVRSVVYPGTRKIGHAWAYLPDFAETALRLIERENELPTFAEFHFDGHWFEHGVQIAEAVRVATGNAMLPIKRFPWWLVRIGSPFVETFREMLEMTYLWKMPLRLDNRRLVAFLGEEPHTPRIDAVRASLHGLGCLETGRTAVSTAADLIKETVNG
jgi:nucleoside-diphosphate-sugar epimerase